MADSKLLNLKTTGTYSDGVRLANIFRGEMASIGPLLESIRAGKITDDRHWTRNIVISTSDNRKIQRGERFSDVASGVYIDADELKKIHENSPKGIYNVPNLSILIDPNVKFLDDKAQKFIIPVSADVVYDIVRPSKDRTFGLGKVDAKTKLVVNVSNEEFNSLRPEEKGVIINAAGIHGVEITGYQTAAEYQNSHITMVSLWESLNIILEGVSLNDLRREFEKSLNQLSSTTKKDIMAPLRALFLD